MALDRWIWRDTFPIDAERLEVAGEYDLSDPPVEDLDILTRVSDYMSEIARLDDLTRRIEHRDQGSTGGGEAELRQIASRMLPVLDAFDRILEYAEKEQKSSESFENWFKAVEGVAERLKKLADKIGLRPIGGVGNEVDLAMHDVVETRATNEYPDSTVIEVRQKGYYFRGKLLRDAKVVVAISA